MSECYTTGVERARNFLCEVDVTPSLGDVAEVAGMNKFVLVRQFRRVLGVTPFAYLLGIRLDRARAMLGRGIRPARAALECGFADQAHLGRHFKRRYGVTPAHYRRSADQMMSAFSV